MTDFTPDLAALLAKSISSSKYRQSDLDLDANITYHDEPAPPPGAFQWNEEQRQAVNDVDRWRRDPCSPRFFKLIGPGGSGKTTVLQEVRNRLRGTRIAWSGMTGKASARMRQASGVPAKTFHAQVFHPPREVDRPLEQKIDLDFDEVKRDGGRETLLVVDEASMIGPKLRADAERSPYQKVLFVGDPFQLPPVLTKAEEAEQGGDYSVFTGMPGPHLTQIMRNAGAVLRAATLVREEQRVPMHSTTEGGSTYEYAAMDSSMAAIDRATRSWLADPTGHVLCTWRNEIRMYASKTIRQALGRSGDLPEPGEPLVIRKNVYGAGLMNGDMVTVESWDDPGPTVANVPTRYLIVRAEDESYTKILVPIGTFDGVIPYVPLQEWRKAMSVLNGEDIIPVTWGYCLTAHMLQGSEARRVTTFLCGDMDNPHFRKMTRLPTGGTMPFALRFLYTAISRAKEHATLLISTR